MNAHKLLLMSTLLLSACSAIRVEHPNDPDFAPVDPSRYAVAEQHNGSIYQEANSLALFESIRARRVGDILTINIEEKTNGQKKATTTGKKANTASITNPTVLGKPFELFGKELTSSVNATRDFNGEGESKQNNQLTGTITVTVYDVLPNGYLRVRGEKWLRMNQGDEFVRIKGIVRPADIRPDNTVPSYLVADARITYSGRGQVSDTNNQGWLARFFGSGFFPI